MTMPRLQRRQFLTALAAVPALRALAAEKLTIVRDPTLLAKPIVVAASPPEPVHWHLRCPHCERFSLVRVGSLPRQARAPPRCHR